MDLLDQLTELVELCCFKITGLIKGRDRKKNLGDIAGVVVCTCREPYFLGTGHFPNTYLLRRCIFNNHNIGYNLLCAQKHGRNGGGQQVKVIIKA